MTNRTVEILGYGFGGSPAEVTVTANGTTVYSGTVPTLDQPVPALPDFTISGETVKLFEFNIPLGAASITPVTCTVTNGTVIFAQTQVNYYPVYNPVYTTNDIWKIESGNSAKVLQVYENRANPALSPADITLLQSTDPADAAAQAQILIDHNLTLQVTGSTADFGPANGANDPKENTTIDGVSQNPDHTGDVTGQWWYRVNSGSVLAFDLDVNVPDPII